MTPRLVVAWIAYQMVMHSPVNIFRRGSPRLRLWAKIALPLAGDWIYRNDYRHEDDQ